jgi:nucleoside-diphosphate-sugar epimerase
MNKLSIFGGTGYIGSKFVEIYPEKSIIIPRESRKPNTENILYLISTTTNQNVFKDLQIDINTNLNLLMEVLSNCKKNDIIFNFVSSCFVYGNDVIGAKESDCVNPTGFYSITKNCAEKMIISFCNTFNVKYRIFRVGNVYGLDPTIGPGKNVLGYMIGLLKSNSDVKLYEGGNFLKDYIFVDDVCKAIDFLIDRGEINQIYNIASGKSKSFKDVILSAKNLLCSKSKILNVEIPKEQKYLQIKNMTLNVDKINSLGFECEMDFESGLKKLCRIVE